MMPRKAHRFHKAYIEITNICGLECSFCPTKTKPKMVMELDFFEKILMELSPFTKDIALHVLGDPLALSNLKSYLDIAQKYKFNVMITTSGNYLSKHEDIFHKSLKQINISLNSYNKNNMKCTFDEYMDEVLKLCEKRVDDEVFINLRLWNLDENRSENPYNQQIFKKLSSFFKIKFEEEMILNPPRSIRLAKKILVHFDHYFEWPNLSSSNSTDGFCHGLSSQLAILADGTVVPCCLDGEGVVDLGNLHSSSLSDILESQKAKNIIDGFKKHKAVEELCKKCTFKDRFNLDRLEI
ncbi:MAG: SPASM domain-containing protein [Sulfurospirillaceae bacterium]|nr:SPASM domain-containing protein [Sulfurospirillaceae bacterium]